MKVKCIEAPDCYELTIGAEYEVVNETIAEYLIYNHVINIEYSYPKIYFELIQEVNLPPMTGEYKEAVQRMLDNFNAKPITYKDFLASMPKSASAAVTMYGDGEVIANVYGFEFACKTEERAEEVYAALITLFKED